MAAFDVGGSWLSDTMLCGLAGPPDGRAADGKSITCPKCGRTSHNPTDVTEGYCGACKDWTSGRARIRLVTNPPGDDLTAVLERTFAPDDLVGLHAAAAAYPAVVRGAGPWAARGAHSEAWDRLVRALGSAVERVKHPPRVLLSAGGGEPEYQQVFITGCKEPFEVLVHPVDGEPYRSTIVPRGATFEFGPGTLPEDADWPPSLTLVPVRPVDPTEETP